MIDYTSNADATVFDLTITNVNTGISYKSQFDGDHLEEIVAGCILSPDQVIQMLTETLSSPDLITKNIRVFWAENMDQALSKCNQLKRLKRCPEPRDIPHGIRSRFPSIHSNAQSTAPDENVDDES